MMHWLLLLLACEGAPVEETEDPPVSLEAMGEVEGTPPSYAVDELSTAARADLRLKRWRQVSLDLQGAMELASDEVCREVGRFDCTTLHGTSMGGVSLDNNLFRPVETVGATTDTAMERLVLGACAARWQADQEAEEPVVFGALDGVWTDKTLATEAHQALLTELYRRHLGRDPSSDEVDVMSTLHDQLVEQGANNGDFALMACFAIGSQTEALLY